MEIKRCVLVIDGIEQLEGQTTILRDKCGRIIGGTMTVKKPFMDIVDIVTAALSLNIEGELLFEVEEIKITGVSDNETEIEWKLSFIR